MARKGDSGEMYKDLFQGVAQATVSIPLLQEHLEQANTLIRANGWSDEEGLRIIFINGLRYLVGQAYLNALGGDESTLAQEIQRLTSELMDVQSKYAVMKFRAYTLDQAKQALEMNVTGLEAENRLSASRLWKFHADEEILRNQIRELQAENQRLAQQVAALKGEADPPSRPGGALRRMLQNIRRRRP